MARPYAVVADGYRTQRGTDPVRAERFVRGDAAALAQVYTRGSTDEGQALEVFTDALRSGQDFATAKARIVDTVGEHRTGSTAFRALAESQRRVLGGRP